VRSGSSDFVLIGQNRTSFFRERSSVDVFPLCKDVLAKVSALKSASGALTNSLGHCSCKGAHVKASRPRLFLLRNFPLSLSCSKSSPIFSLSLIVSVVFDFLGLVWTYALKVGMGGGLFLPLCLPSLSETMHSL